MAICFAVTNMRSNAAFISFFMRPPSWLLLLLLGRAGLSRRDVEADTTGSAPAWMSRSAARYAAATTCLRYPDSLP